MYGDEIEPGDYPVFLPAVSNGLNMLIPDDFSRTDKWLPAWGGISIGHPDTTAGTNGGRICHLGDCNCFISNAHVMGGLEGAQIGDPIYQPGPHDGGTPEDVIGYIVAMAKPVKSKANLVDAAIACGDETTVYSKIYGLGTVTQVYADPQAGDKATKCGRTTGCTLATLISPDTFVKVGYYTSHSKLPQMYTFIHQMLFSGVSDPGDSGSMLVAGEWVITETQFGKWEALLFAGNEDNQIMANNPVYVLEALPGAYMPGTPAETSPYPAPGNSYP
ncbi:MAG: hypothetical protein JW908_00560 [Anaerolineales bacterium]|nr:hypothetical protein [Anaerolineales bacterium]